ncbi:3-hydroxyacyl-CoA dehydrogenase [Orrella sp. 11846]|uniref:3-hydroxyacyl-CoA dehydrogenase n=1 Tax=Orrella sp. 11846 TaxID=3409913 RepID=UPI003B598882
MKAIKTVGVIGVGAMGKGIVQIAAQAGFDVMLFDQNGEAVQAAIKDIGAIWNRLVEKGRMTEEAVDNALANLHIAQTLGEMARCDVVIEAIIERLDIKQALFKELEGVVSEQCILATNTSSLSVTAIAAQCEHPQRVAGFHFFNPVPLMKVVEVIDGTRGDPAVGDALMTFASEMGHTPVRCKDMPGFIVNHAGRGLSTEGFRVVQEQVADYETVDRVMREQCGFRMGPFELMDLTGLDVSHFVMESIYRQFYDETRFRPSPLGTLRVAAGLYGRKSNGGFYNYSEGKKNESPMLPVPAFETLPSVWVSPAHPQGHAIATAWLRELGAAVQTGSRPDDSSLIVVTPYGEDVCTAIVEQDLDPERTVGLDTFGALSPQRHRTLMVAMTTTPHWRDVAHAILALDQVQVSIIQDSPGFVGQRIQAMIVNIACEIAQQGIATPTDIDRAVKLGLGYPAGPLSLGDSLGAAAVLEILENMHIVTGDMRYRPSLWLRRRVLLGRSLLECSATA